jgi:hypothetical protein
MSNWQHRSNQRAWLLLMVAVLSRPAGFGDFMTSSRRLVCQHWALVVDDLGIKQKIRRSLERWKFAFIFGGIAIGILAGAMILIPAGNPARILDLAPGMPTGQSRQAIGRLTIRLIRDFAFTGGGLGAFPGLFSQYMLVIPNVLYKYSHNLYLDVALDKVLLVYFAAL